jgi:hypothetical protein
LEFVRRDYSDEIPFEVLMDLYDDDENTWCRLAIYRLHFEIHVQPSRVIYQWEESKNILKHPSFRSWRWWASLLESIKLNGSGFCRMSEYDYLWDK